MAIFCRRSSICTHSTEWFTRCSRSISLSLSLARSLSEYIAKTTHIRTLSHSFAEHSTKEAKKKQSKPNDAAIQMINIRKLLITHCAVCVFVFRTQFLPVQCCCQCDCYRAHTSIRSFISLSLNIGFCYSFSVSVS